MISAQNKTAPFPRFSPIGFMMAASLVAIFLLKGVFFHPRVCFSPKNKNVCLRVELARTPAEHARGLMFRKTLSQGRGMLFIFPEDDLWSFWMKNTYIPLDIIWLDAKRRVVGVATAQPASPVSAPPVFAPSSPARYVLEAKAGFAAENDIGVSDAARFDWIFHSKRI